MGDIILEQLVQTPVEQQQCELVERMRRDRQPLLATDEFYAFHESPGHSCIDVEK